MKDVVGVILLAGPSGSGKSYIAHRSGLPVLCLDDFYKDGNDPTLPCRHGRVDWDSPLTWDSAAAVRAIAALARDGRAQVPVYAIDADRRIGSRTLDVNGSPMFVAEGIFAAEIVSECERLGVLAGAYVLRRRRTATFFRRLARDLAERRKPPGVVLRRGLALVRSEPAVLRRQIELGCRPTGARQFVADAAAMAAASAGQAGQAVSPTEAATPTEATASEATASTEAATLTEAATPEPAALAAGMTKAQESSFA